MGVKKEKKNILIKLIKNPREELMGNERIELGVEGLHLISSVFLYGFSV